MAERKPPGIDFETWVDRQIRDAADRGAFDDLPGAGKPLPEQGAPDDELWWVKNYLRREGVSTDALLPTPLRLRKQIEQLPDTVRDLRSEQAVRDVVAELNRQVADWLRAPSGPWTVRPVNADSIVRQWRAEREAATAGVAPTPPTTDNPSSGPTRWWQRLARRRPRSEESPDHLAPQ
jgi:hypothetical protein